MAPRVLGAVCDTLGWDYGGLWEVDGPGTALRLVGTWQCESGRFAEFVELGRSMALARGVGLPGRVWAGKRAEWIPDVVVDGNFPRAEAARTRRPAQRLRPPDSPRRRRGRGDGVLQRRHPGAGCRAARHDDGGGRPDWALRRRQVGRRRARRVLRPVTRSVVRRQLRGVFPPSQPGLGADARFRGRGDARHALHGLRASGRSRSDAHRDGAPDRRRTRHQLREPLSHAGRLVSLARLGLGARFRAARRLCGCP